MDVEMFDYDLPDTAIAQVPVDPRDAARLLVDGGPDREPRHRQIADLADVLRPGDLLVVNDTRVRPARLLLRKPTGGAAEVLLINDAGDGRWEALVRPGRRLPPGTVLDGPGVTVTVGDDLGDGRRRVEVRGDPDTIGRVPLPPYIHTDLADSERYQTVYARRPGSVAAPTAGLHLTEHLLERCADRGIGLGRLELVVGLDTFRPITTPHIEDHPMHSEEYDVPEDTLAACAATRAAGGRVVAVGTTVVRALESAATGQRRGRTRLFIHGHYNFQLVDMLMTNFHLPRTTLLALVDAFVGARWRDLYAIALADGYRFLSFGDAMLVARRTAP